MINQTTVNKLHDMRLSAMTEACREQMENCEMSALSFDEWLGMMVDFKWNRRKSNYLMVWLRVELTIPQCISAFLIL